MSFGTDLSQRPDLRPVQEMVERITLLLSKTNPSRMAVRSEVEDEDEDQDLQVRVTILLGEHDKVELSFSPDGTLLKGPIYSGLFGTEKEPNRYKLARQEILELVGGEEQWGQRNRKEEGPK